MRFEIAGVVADGHTGGEVAIGADGTDGDGIEVGTHGAAGEIDEREGDLRTVVVAAGALAAHGLPESLFGLPGGPVAVRVEGLEVGDVAAGGVGAEDLFDGEDLHGERAADVGDDAVLGFVMGEEDRLGCLLEEVDNRRAVELE